MRVIPDNSLLVFLSLSLGLKSLKKRRCLRWGGRTSGRDWWIGQQIYQARLKERTAPRVSIVTGSAFDCTFNDSTKEI